MGNKEGCTHEKDLRFSLEGARFSHEFLRFSKISMGLTGFIE